jgi:DNA (cytosine-5)-methyltransferase 1
VHTYTGSRREPREYSLVRLQRVVSELQEGGVPVLLDLFCGTGGATMGYFNAGFFVIGVDRVPQKYYPFPQFVADAFAFVRWAGDIFDAYHASPPCQLYSKTRYLVPPLQRRAHKFIDLIPQTRHMFQQQVAPYKPWVIENVEGAPLEKSLLLCGTMFLLPTYRHRIFESNVELTQPPHPEHVLRSDDIGNKKRHNGVPLMRQYSGHFGGLAMAQEDLSMYWARVAGISQALPPVYTQYIGGQLLDYFVNQQPYSV